MADAVSIPNPARDREDRYVAGLRAELVSHEQRGNDDRVDQVRAELKRLGHAEDPDQDSGEDGPAEEPTAEPSRRRTTEGRPAPEKAVPPGPKRGG